MIRRTYASPQPNMTGGDDRPTPACEGNYLPFDVLADKSSGRAYEAAKAEILSEKLCGGCALRDAGCWAENKEREEPWFYSLLGRPIPRHPRGVAA